MTKQDDEAGLGLSEALVPPSPDRPTLLIRVGFASWSVVGLVAVLAICLLILSALSEVAIPVLGTAERLAGIRRRVLLAISLVLGLALISGFAVSRLLGVRIRRLASTAATLAQGDLSARARI